MAAAAAASPGRLRRLMGAATDAVLFTSLCAMRVTNAGSVFAILARRAGADDRLSPVAAARGATSFSVAVFSVLLPAFVPMFVLRVESLKKVYIYICIPPPPSRPLSRFELDSIAIGEWILGDSCLLRNCCC